MTAYTGNDLIFATGAPGSKWSRILSTLGLHPEINNSDKDKFPKYNLSVTMKNGRTIPVGNHSGAYFGPGNGIGEKFDNLTKLSKKEFIEEIKKPFDNWEQGVKIIKSHWFSYDNNLQWLRSNFPDSKIVLIYNGDDIAFKWWHFVGGWDIDFPTYSWYNNDERMYKKILEENNKLLSFAREHLVPIKFYRYFTEFLSELNLNTDLEFIKTLNEEDITLINRMSSDESNLHEKINASTRGAGIGVLSQNSQKCADYNEFDAVLSEVTKGLLLRHDNFRIDEMLSDRHGKEWLNQINTIIKSASFDNK